MQNASKKQQKDMTYAFLAYWQLEKEYEPTLFDFYPEQLYTQIPSLPKRFILNNENRCKNAINRGIEVLIENGYLYRDTSYKEIIYGVTNKLSTYRFGRENFKLRRKIQENPMEVLLPFEN